MKLNPAHECCPICEGEGITCEPGEPTHEFTCYCRERPIPDWLAAEINEQQNQMAAHAASEET